MDMRRQARLRLDQGDLVAPVEAARKISGSVYLPPNHRYAPPKCRPMQLTRFSRADDQPDNHDGTTKLLV